MVGTEVSHYRIIEQLGSGGMGIIYKAVDLRLDRTVALKFLSPFLTSDSESRERFIREAKAASALQHNNICTVHDIDQAADGRLFIVMDCYHGSTLKKRLEEGPLSVPETTGIARQIASGLAAAHEQGIIHRDIKSENIFVTNDGVVKILDFGLAKLRGQSLTTTEGTTKGTVSYMSPEQVAGLEVDTSTDVWSFGVVLYEMLAGRLPFQGHPSPAVMYAILHEEPPEVSSIQPDIPPVLARICMQCLAKDRFKRPSSMADILADLEGESSGHRRKAGPAVWLTLTVCAIGAAALSILYWPRSRVEPLQTPHATLAVLQFKNLTRDSTVAEWPEAVQALMVSCLTGVEGLRVYDPAGMNTVTSGMSNAGMEFEDLPNRPHLPPVDFTVEGSILREDPHFVVHMNVRDRNTQEVLSSNLSIVGSEADLPRIADSLSLLSVEILQSRSVLPGHENHLQPWWPNQFRSVYAMKAFTQACQLALAGDQTRSEQALRRAIALDTSFVTPRVWLVSRLVSRGDTAEAALHFRTLLAERDSAGPFDRAIISWAEACVNRDLPGQIAALNHALEYSPGNAILLYSLGRAEYISRNYRECAALLQPVADRKWEYPSLYLLLAQAYDMIEQYGPERKVLEAALSMRRPPPEAHIFLATLYRRSNDRAAAKAEDDSFIAIMTQRGESLRTIYTSLSNLNITEGFLNDGVRYYRLAIRNAGEQAVAHLDQAESFCERRDTLNAIVEFLRAIAVDSTDAAAPFHLAEILTALHEPQKAIEYYKTSIALDSSGLRAGTARTRIAALQQ